MEQDKLFSRESLLLIPGAILLNFVGAKLALALELPLFLDSVGTILAGALGGLLPGITVGFFSNVLNSIGDPITLYYGLISILIGVAAVFFSRRGCFTRFGRTLLSSLAFALIGGALGSLLTWMLYGLNIGYGISAPLAMQIYIRTDASAFLAQLIADMGIDILDKALTLTIVYLALRALPDRLLNGLPNGEIYRRAKQARVKTEEGGQHGA